MLKGSLPPGASWSPLGEGTAFYALQSCANHSCRPAARAFKGPEERDGAAVLLALRPIAAGDEVTISYVDEEEPLGERRAALADYGFECACEKCVAEELDGLEAEEEDMEG